MKTLKIITVLFVIATLILYIIKLPMFLPCYIIWILFLSIIQWLELPSNPKIIPLGIILSSISFILIPIGIYFSTH